MSDHNAHILAYNADRLAQARATVVCAIFAADHLGSVNPASPTFSNMIKALSLHPWSNTAEETLRLRAAKWVRHNAANRKAYLAEIEARRRNRR